MALIGYPEDGGLILKGMFQKDLTPDKVPVYITDGMQDNALYKQIDAKDPAVTEGIKGTAAAAAPTNGAPFFPDEFKKFAPEVESPIYSSQSYDCAVLFALAAQQGEVQRPVRHRQGDHQRLQGRAPRVPRSAAPSRTASHCSRTARTSTTRVPAVPVDFTEYGEPSAGQYEVYSSSADGKYENDDAIDIAILDRRLAART